MSLFRVAALLLMCGILLSTVGKSATAQNSATKEAAKTDDVPKSIAESVSGTLQFAEGNFIGLAEAMPEDKYSYTPAVGKFEGVRSFGEQVKHLACAQFAFFNEFEGKKPPEDCEKGGHDPAKTKAELIKYLKDREVLFSFRRGVEVRRADRALVARPRLVVSAAQQIFRRLCEWL